MSTHVEVKSKMAEGRFSITNKTRGKLPRVNFLNIKDKVLGKEYSLSLVFLGKEKSRKLNFTYRGKNKPANILSFPLDKKTGEIFICPSVAKKETPFLFIHGILHLKGMLHGSTMERAEVKLRKQFLI